MPVTYLANCDAPSTTTPYTYDPTAVTTTGAVNIVGTDLTIPTNTVTLSGYTTDQVLVFSKPTVAASGGLLSWDAASAWNADGANPPGTGLTWGNQVSIYGNNGGADILLFSFTGAPWYSTAALAQAALAAVMPFTASGYTTYKLTGLDDSSGILTDNRGGLSILVEVRSPGWVPTSQTTPTGATGGGTYVDVIASEALGAGDMINLWNSSGTLKARKASAADDTKPADGYVLSAVASGWTARVHLPGTVDTQRSSLTVGSVYFLDPSTGGAITATAPSGSGQLSQVVGKAISATALEFAPRSGITLR